MKLANAINYLHRLVSKSTIMKLIPYLHFNGNCEEVLNAYINILDGSGQVVARFGDNPAYPVPEEHKNRVMHASLQFDDNVIMLSDSMPGHQVIHGNGVNLSINHSDEERIRRIFAKLADGGQITMPLEKQFWGALFGQVIDKFDIRWMISCP